jgi:signal peptidase II
MQAARGAPLSSSGHDDTHARRRPLALFFTVALVAWTVDVVTKVIAVERLSDRDPVPVLGDFLQLTLVRNPGAAFSTGTSYTVVLAVVAIGAVAVVLVMSRRLGDRLWAFGLGCLLGGVLGNLTDRIFREPGPLRGHVVDFLQLPSWPVFNVADICINVAAGVIILQAIRGVSHTGEREARTKNTPPEDEVAGA